MSISDLVSVVGVLTAIIALIIESRMTKIALYTQAMLELNKEFYGGKISERRRSAAKKLLLNQSAPRELEDILDFFTDIAIMTERGALDKNLVYDMYSYWMIYYWEIAQDVVKEGRKKDPEGWKVLERLVVKLAKDEKLDHSPEAIKSFLREEARVEE